MRHHLQLHLCSILFTILLILLCAVSITRAESSWIWNKETGWIDPNIRADTDEEILGHGIALYTQEHYASAYAIFKKLAKKSHKAHIVQEAYWHQALALRAQGKLVPAAEKLNQLVEMYPSAARVTQAAQEEFDIAREVEAKGKPEKAIAIYNHAAQHAPTSNFADDALIHVADAYFKTGDYEEALAAYDQVINVYSESEWVPKAMYRTALCELREAVTNDYDRNTLVKARQSLNECLHMYPNSEFAVDCQEKLRTSESMLARRQYEIALFYRRVHQPMALATTCANLIRDYPHTEWAAKAGEILDDVARCHAIRLINRPPALIQTVKTHPKTEKQE